MLHVHRSERADGLVEALRILLADAPPDPFTPDVVAVPTRGMERWLTQRLSDRLGICANVVFPSPRRLTSDAVAAASGVDPRTDPWLPERLVWPLLEVVDERLGEPWLRDLRAHLHGAGRARRFGAVRHLAELFDRYALLRPELVRGWVAGEASGHWQAELWRHLRTRLGTPDPAERRAGACARLREQPELAGLPPRLALFGLTRLPAGHLEVLDALAAGHDVHLLLLHPSPALWRRIGELLAGRPPVVRRAADPTASVPAAPLLASWGQDARELQLVLGQVSSFEDHHHPVGSPAGTVLAVLQAAVRDDVAPAGAPLPGRLEARPELHPTDHSVQVHACHGRARQVEVIRDAILHELAADPSLEPRDVIVMCPDIETFAPLIQATFGAGEVSAEEDELPALPRDVRPPDLRVRLADRSLRQTNPLLGVVSRLLELAEQRLTASQVLDLADREPVRRRFRLDDDDLGRIEEWVADAGVRWGLDAAHRAPFKLDKLPSGTWRAGLDRLLVGVTMTEDGLPLFEGVLPLEDVESGAIDLAGRLAELLDRLQTVVDAFADPKPIAAWASAIADAADGLTATAPREAWQRAELQRLLDDVVSEAAGHATALELGEVRALLAERLQGRPTRANFRTGHLTICTLVPMRSVPHRVVCLLGLDDAAFPRKAPRDGDDLVLDDPHLGDRDPRAEDRQMLLDALLAASDKLIVTYTGNDERTNAPRPPAVPVGELLDVIDRTVRRPDGRRAREQVVVRHPLQPFDARNFVAGALVPGDGPWSFDRVTLEGARALSGPRAVPGPFLAGPLPDERAVLIELEDLVRFVQHPVRAFLRQRLGISVGDFTDELEDALPVELDALEAWAVGQRLLEARLAGVDRRDGYRAEIARGTLPPGVLGKPVVERVLPIVEAIVAHATSSGGPGGTSVDVRVALPGGRTLSGTVPGLHGDELRAVNYSRVGPRHRLAAWVRLLALTAADPEHAYHARTVGRVRSGADRGFRVTVARVGPLAADAEGRRAVAMEHLAVLLDLFDRGLREPLPLPCQASAEYARAATEGADPGAAARGAWTSAWNYPKEDAELDHQLVFGGIRSFDELWLEAGRADETGPGWDADDPSRFGRLARRLWSGLLAHELLEDA